MVIFTTHVDVTGISAKSIYDFLLACDDEQYQRWWPGTHLAFHTIKRTPSNVGNRVYMDEYVGEFHVRFHAVVKELVPNRRIIWQLKALGLLLPAWVSIAVVETANGVKIIHTVSAGYRGLGRVLDIGIRRYLSSRFERQMAEHAGAEFNRLRDLLLPVSATSQPRQTQ
jgi:uncharacterized protein YndB with AHSA1/START domain